MPTFISLITETQQGETQIKKSVDRANQFQQEAAKFGAKVTATYWTMGGKRWRSISGERRSRPRSQPASGLRIERIMKAVSVSFKAT
jgi:hypothetical protein